MIDYGWIADVEKAISSNNLFNATISGAQELALALLLFKVIGSFLNSAEGETPRIGGILNIIGYGLIIVSSSWVVESIESLFSSTNYGITNMNTLNETHPVKDYLLEVDKAGNEYTGLAKVAYYVSLIKVYLTASVLYLISIICHLLDVAITGMYLFQRVFLIKLFRFIFPFAIALSTTKGFEDMLPKWIKIYIGLFILGIAYVGILNFSNIVYTTIASKAVRDPITDLTSGFENIAFAEFGAILISMLIKFALMSLVTREVRNYFS